MHKNFLKSLIILKQLIKTTFSTQQHNFGMTKTLTLNKQSYNDLFHYLTVFKTYFIYDNQKYKYVK